jgi:acetylornithine deacetylase/succinyl-diaminopimelate desuccinylase-like protein
MKKLIIFLSLVLGNSSYAASIQQEKLTEYLSQLVAMPTETADKEENGKALLWVEQQLAPLGLHFKHQVFEGHPTLVITTKDTKTPDIFLVSHIDVVPAPKVWEGRL